MRPQRARAASIAAASVSVTNALSALGAIVILLIGLWLSGNVPATKLDQADLFTALARRSPKTGCGCRAVRGLARHPAIG